MVLFLRGWNEDFVDSGGDFFFANSQAQFNLIIPASYTPGDPFSMTFTGGLASEGTPPDSISTVIGVTPYNKQGGVALDVGPFSDTGLTYAIGNTYLRYQSGTAVSWTAIGPGAPITAVGLGQTNISANTLVDGSPTAPGEGAIPTLTTAMQPVGWFPAMAFIAPPSIPIHTVSLEPGQTVTLQFFTQSISADAAHPTRSFYPYITSITVNIGAEAIAIPLGSVKTGFNVGAASAPWTTGIGQPVAPWNAFGTVSATQPAAAAQYQDMWLAGTQPTQRGQGYIF